MGWPKVRDLGRLIRIRGSIVEVVGEGPIEDEFRGRRSLGEIEFGGLVEEEVALWRASGR